MMHTIYRNAVKDNPLKREVLESIIKRGPDLAAHCIQYRNEEAVTRTCRTMNQWKFIPLHRKRWRITGLPHLPRQYSLWICSNGRYYIGEHVIVGARYADRFYPHTWYEAPIHMRSLKELKTLHAQIEEMISDMSNGL